PMPMRILLVSFAVPASFEQAFGNDYVLRGSDFQIIVLAGNYFDPAYVSFKQRSIISSPEVVTKSFLVGFLQLMKLKDLGGLYGYHGIAIQGMADKTVPVYHL